MPKTVADTFTASEVAVLAEINIETLRVWRRRDYFKLQGEEAGSWTRFTFADVLKIATFRSLVSGHVDHVAAEIITANAPEHFAAVLGGEDDSPAPYAILAANAQGQVFEVVGGFDNLTARLGQLMFGKGAGRPVFHVVDYTAILQRVMLRLNAMNRGTL